MANSRYQLPGAFHSRVYRSNDYEYFILVPDVAPGETGRFDTQVFEVSHEPISDSSETYQVFRKGRRRADLESGMRIVGRPWGTHTILEPGAVLSREDIDSFRSQFTGPGCLLFLVGIPLAAFGVIHTVC